MTKQRLTATRLTDINRDVSWRFSESVVKVENDRQPLPSDVVATLLGGASTCSRIEATWQLNEKSGTLQLSQMKVDDNDIVREVTVPITPAGHVRVNLAGRQYNMFAGEEESR